jgi:quinol monooxygenase YgiN
MILVTLTIAVPPGQRNDFVEVFWSLLGPVRVEAGCLGCGLYHEIGNEDVLLYVEQWETPEQLERHVRSARYERLLTVMEASIKPPLLRYHVVSGIKGLEYLEAVRLGGGASPPLAQDPSNQPGIVSQQREPDAPAK